MVEFSGSLSSRDNRARPELLAISITAVSPSPMAPQEAVSFFPMGPVTLVSLVSPSDPSTNVSSVPSPPSATGQSITSASGNTLTTPFSAAVATPRALMLPLYACGAITIFTFHRSFSMITFELDLVERFSYDSYFYIVIDNRGKLRYFRLRI